MISNENENKIEIPEPDYDIDDDDDDNGFVPKSILHYYADDSLLFKKNPGIEQIASITSHDTFKSLNLSLFDTNQLILNDIQQEKQYESKSSVIIQNRKLAGFWNQLAILTWKNLILTKRNMCGLLTEILCPLFIIALLIIIRYFVTAKQSYDETNALYNVIDIMPITNKTNATLLLYYPNNSLIQTIVTNAVSIIRLRKPSMRLDSEFFLA